jgi:hypothetical protein
MQVRQHLLLQQVETCPWLLVWDLILEPVREELLALKAELQTASQEVTEEELR